MLVLEQLEDRSLPSAASVLASLQDANIQTLAQADYNRDGGLSRGDMIGIFNEVAKEGKKLTSVEVADLNTLVNNSSTLGMPADVAGLAGKVVGYNQANAKFHGKALVSGGQLAAGQSSAALTDLVDKWFLGEDLPKAVDYWGTTYKYATAHGSLFGSGGPSNLNVVQGEAGDCYFMAALAETADRDPQAIRSMFIDNGDGTFSVRFFHEVGDTQEADYVTVNRSLPVDRWGRFVFANMGETASSSNTVLWVALAEKAYAQLSAEGWSRAGLARPVNSYGSINGGFGYQAMQQVLGEATTWMSTHSTDATNIAIADLAAGDLITLGSDSSEPKKSHVVADHEYYVTGYDASTKTFTAVNPWGAHLAKIGTLHLTAAQVVHWFGEIDVAPGS